MSPNRQLDPEMYRQTSFRLRLGDMANTVYAKSSHLHRAAGSLCVALWAIRKFADGDSSGAVKLVARPS
jgi:hypothetical protein